MKKITIQEAPIDDEVCCVDCYLNGYNTAVDLANKELDKKDTKIIDLLERLDNALKDRDYWKKNSAAIRSKRIIKQGE